MNIEEREKDIKRYMEYRRISSGMSKNYQWNYMTISKNEIEITIYYDKGNELSFVINMEDVRRLGKQYLMEILK